MKLYRLQNEIGDYWVIAENPTQAEEKLMKMLDENDYGFNKSRIVTSFHVIAEAPDDTRFITGKFLVL